MAILPFPHLCNMQHQRSAAWACEHITGCNIDLHRRHNIDTYAESHIYWGATPAVLTYQVTYSSDVLFNAIRVWLTRYLTCGTGQLSVQYFTHIWKSGWDYTQFVSNTYNVYLLSYSNSNGFVQYEGCWLTSLHSVPKIGEYTMDCFVIQWRLTRLHNA